VCALLGAVLTLSAVRWLVGRYDDDPLDSRSLRIGSTVAGLDRVEPSPAEAAQIDAQRSRMRAVGIDDPQLVILGSPTPAGQQMRLVVGKLGSDDPDRAARDAIAGALSTVGEVDPSRISGHPAGPLGGAVACSTARGWGCARGPITPPLGSSTFRSGQSKKPPTSCSGSARMSSNCPAATTRPPPRLEWPDVFDQDEALACRRKRSCLVWESFETASQYDAAEDRSRRRWWWR
jgi:hypothetical protein